MSLIETAAAAASRARSVPLRVPFKLVYGAGSIVEGTVNAALTYFLLFYLTSVCGMSGTMAGTALLIGLLVDAIADPIIGLASDDTRSPLGRRYPYLLFSILPLAACFVLVFSIPASLHGSALFAYATGCAIALRIGLSLFHLPYIAVGAEVTDDYNQRSSIVAYRVPFTMIGTFAAIALGLGMFLSGPGAILQRSAYIPFALSCAVLILAGGAAGTWATRQASPRLHQPPSERSSGLGHLRDLRDVFRSRSFVTLFAAVLSFFVAQGLAGGLAIHLNSFFWGLSSGQVQLVLIGAVVGPLLGAPIAALLVRRFDKRTLAIAGFLVFLLAQLWPVLVRLGGGLMFDANAVAAVLLGNAMLGGVGLVTVAIGGQSMMADATDEHELNFGVRREGLFFSGISLAQKSASGLGGFLAGLALDIIHFPPAPQINVELSPRLIGQLGIIAGPLPAVITLIAPLVLLGYTLTRQRHAAVLTALKDRELLRAKTLDESVASLV